MDHRIARHERPGRGEAIGLAGQATDQLRKMSFEQRGFPAEWARARKVDSLFAQDDWVAGARALLEALDTVNPENKAPARSGPCTMSSTRCRPRWPS